MYDTLLYKFSHVKMYYIPEISVSNIDISIPDRLHIQRGVDVGEEHLYLKSMKS